MAVKELQRSLLARMLRHGVIDATTYTERVQALGFTADDTFLTLKLEQSEAVRTTLRSTTFFSGSVAPLANQDIEVESEATDVTGLTYLNLTIKMTRPEGTYFRCGLRFYDTADAKVGEIITPGVYGTREFWGGSETVGITESVPDTTATVKIVVVAVYHDRACPGISYEMISLVGVKV